MVTKSEARVFGLKRYDTLRKCKRCGGRERYLSTGGCVTCSQSAAKKQRAEAAKSALRPNQMPSVPLCLIVPGVEMCQSCDKRNRCPAAYKTDTLVRAKVLHRAHAAVEAVYARRLGMTICKPSKPCGVCGHREWRNLNSRYCLNCYDELRHLFTK